ncbi:MAG: cadherin-like beta sandwich domain-containing protein [Bacteroidota bacterium]
MSQDGKETEQAAWLEAQGFTVIVDESTMQAGLSNASQSKLDELNSADLIIMGRAVGSGNFESPNKAYVNAIKAPVLQNSLYAARSQRANWFPTAGQTTTNDDGSGLAVDIVAPADPIFAAVTLTGNTCIMYNGNITAINETTHNGTTLAEINGRPLITRFTPHVEFYNGAGERPSGNFTLFSFGENPPGSFFPHNDDGKAIYLAEINRMAALGQATASSNADLKSLTLDAGTLEPAFDPAVTSYEVAPAGATEINISAEAVDFYASVAGTGAAASPSTATITVTADDGTTKDYTINILGPPVDDASLVALTSDPAGTLTPAFDAGTLTYDLEVPPNTASVTLIATATSGYATVTGDGTIDVSSGTATATVIVTAEDGTTTETYTVNISVAFYGQQVIYLMSQDGKEIEQAAWLEAQGFNLIVDESTMQAGLSNAPQSKLDELNSADLIIMGRAVGSGNFASPNKPYVNAIKAPVLQNSVYAARDFRANWFPTNGQTATNDDGSGLAVDIVAPADPIFAAVTLTDNTCIMYSGNITAIKETTHNGTTLAEINGRPLITRFTPHVEFYNGSGDRPSGNFTLFSFGENPPGSFFPHNDDGKAIYLAEINRMAALGQAPASSNADLKSLAVSVGTLSPAFDPAVTSYEVKLPAGTATDLDISGERVDFYATVAGTGTVSVPSTTTVTVTADDGTTKDYTVTVSEINDDATLSALTCDLGSLTPAFDAATLTYDLNLPFGSTSVTLTATSNDATATVAGDGTIDLSSGSASAAIVVTAQDGTTTSTYAVNITVVAKSKTIIFMTDAGEEDAQIAWLAAQGFAVVEDNATMQAGLSTASAAKLDELNDASLIIMGRGVSSTNFQGDHKPYVNAIKAPLVQNSLYAARDIRANWFPTASQTWFHNDDNGIAVKILDATDPIFAGVTLSDTGTVVMYYEDSRYINATTNNGTTLAEVDGMPAITRFTPHVEFYDDAGDRPSGNFTMFSFGEDSPRTFFPLTDDGKTIYLAELNRMAALGQAPASSNADLKSLTASAGTLSPDFDPAVTSYEIVFPAGTAADIEISGEKVDFYATVAGTGTVSVPSTTTVTVTADDGSTKDYTVTVREIGTDATLSALTTDVGSLDPVFEPGVTTYTLDVPEGTTGVNLTATASDAHATLTGDGAIDVSSGSATATITVTAEDGTTLETYTVDITVLVGVEESQASGMRVYPTVSNGIFYVELAQQAGRVRVLDITGTMIHSFKATSSLETVTVDEAGIYFILLDHEGLQEVVKVISVK